MNNDELLNPFPKELYPLAIDLAEKETSILLKDDPTRELLGFCHFYWGMKKKILKERYGIDWKTPAEEHPEIIFD